MIIKPIAYPDEAATGYNIANSGAFASEQGDYLNRVFAVAGDRQKWTVSFLVKRNGLGGTQNLFGNYNGSGLVIRFEPTDTLSIYDASVTGGNLETSAVFRDVSNYYHIVIRWDTTQATANDRMQLEINNVVITDFKARTNPALNSSGGVNRADSHRIGQRPDGANNANVLFSEFHFIDGQALTPDNFGEYDSTGNWVAKPYTGTYGTNGFYLEFKDALDLGKDTSGKGNHLNNTGVIQSTDTPTNNACTLNAIDPLTTGALTNNALTTTSNAKTTYLVESGKWYYEKGGVGISHDTSIDGDFDPTLLVGDYVFTESDFVSAPPAGFLPLTSANLPDDTVVPSEYFKALTYSGTGASVSREIGFQADMVWMKGTDVADNHHIVDSARGLNGGGVYENVYSNLTAAESNNNAITNLGLTTIDMVNSNGNLLGNNYVAWCFKKLAGAFDIVTTTGTGIIRNIAHNLTVPPELIIGRQRNVSNQWPVLAQDANNGSGHLGIFYLNLTNAWVASTNVWNNTAPTSTEFTVGTNTLTNANGGDYVYYLWASLEGFSKVGSYTGNGSADGTFINTNGRPALVMIKDTSAANSWFLYDSSRDIDNPVSLRLSANLSDAESVESNNGVDFLSNGFKCRGSGTSLNTNGNTYIYLCIFEQSFKNSRAR